VKEEVGRFYVHSVGGWKVTNDLASVFESFKWAACIVIDLHEMSKLLVASVVKHSESPLYWVLPNGDGMGEGATERWKNVVLRNVKMREPPRRRMRK
jgi:hypothetical protein